MLYTEVIFVYCENYTIHSAGKIQLCLVLKLVVPVATAVLKS
jgi:hypothetical protein